MSATPSDPKGTWEIRIAPVYGDVVQPIEVFTSEAGEVLTVPAHRFADSVEGGRKYAAAVLAAYDKPLYTGPR